MTDGFDIVAVGVENKRRIVVRMIVRAQARPAIILAAGGDGSRMEGIDLGAAARGEGDVLMILLTLPSLIQNVGRSRP
jgi:hypothetical protein